jgi:type VI secretion system protein ImpE
MEISMGSMSTADLFRAGRLHDSIEAQSAAVRAAPSDIPKRWLLAELLCFAGDWERADRSLDVIALQTSQQRGAVLAFQNLLRGEEMRRQVFTEGRAPQILGAGVDALRPATAALLCLREGRLDDAICRIAEGKGSTAAVAGIRNGEEPFDSFRDLDDVCAPFVELIAEGGQYHWVSVVDIASIETRPLATARDLIWRPAHLAVRNGPKGDVFLPAIYVTDPQDGDEALRLGRRTEWIEQAGSPVRGVGLRTFLIGDDDVPIHELGRLEFAN